MFKKKTKTAEIIARSVTLTSPTEVLSAVINGLRKGAAGEQADLEHRNAEDDATQTRLWKSLLVTLEEQYGIPAEAVEKVAPRSMWIGSGFYEGPIRLCGVPLDVIAELIPGTNERGFATLKYRARFRLPGKVTSLTATEVAEIIEKAAAE